MTIPNPFHTNRNKPQQINWKHFIEKEEYHMEFILPFQCIINELGRGGSYLSICAVVLKNQKLNVSEVLADQMIIMDIPNRTWENAWQCVNYKFRNDFLPEHNLRVSFIKMSKQDIRLLDLEKTIPSKEQKEFAEDFYSNPDKFDPMKRTIRRRTEEL